LGARSRSGSPKDLTFRRRHVLSEASGWFVPLWIAGKLALYLAMIERGVNNSELARRLGVRETVVRRMLDPDHETKSEKLQTALEMLGKRIVVAVDDAA
jgi:antitoxin HicB